MAETRRTYQRSKPPIDRVEPAIERVALLHRHRRPQPQRALGRLQGRGVDRADQRGRGDHQSELGIELSGQPGQERSRDEDRHQHQGDADDRAEQFVHRLDGGVMAAQTHFDVVGGALHDDDCVIHHDADRQHDGKQGRKVDGEAKRRHCREGTDNRYRHGRRRHQSGANVLQEHQNDNQHQHAGLDQRLIDFIDRGGDEFRGVERNVVLHALREPARQLRHLRSDFIHHGQRVGAGRLEDRHARGWLTVKGEGLRIGLRPKLHAPDVADAGDRARPNRS